MINSSHTSFMTATQDYSPKASFENHNANCDTSSHSSGHCYEYKKLLDHNENNANVYDLHSSGIKSGCKNDGNVNGEIVRSKSYQSLSRPSFESEGLESCHTIFENDMARASFSVNRKPNEVFDAKSTSSHISHSTKVALSVPRTSIIAWVLLFFVVLMRAATAIFNNTFSPIPYVTAQFFGVSLTSINWLFNITYITFMISCFFTSWIFRVLGVKWSLVISGVTLSLGCWVRWIAVKISPPSFKVLMVGQSIASFSSPLSLNIMTTFSTLWFTENLRATAGVFIVSNYGGIIAMFLLPNIATDASKIELTIILVACIASATTLPLFFFPKKPKIPTSYTVDEKTSKHEVSLKRGVILLLQNPHFLTLSAIHGLNTGASNAWGILMNQAISPYGYSDSQIGNIAAIGVIAGTVGCLIAGPVLDKTKQHKILLKIMAPLMFSTYIAFIFVVKAESFAAILYVNLLNQFFLSFMVPVCIELGVEVSHPVPESLSTSIMWQISQVLGFTLSVVMDLFRDPDGLPKNNMFKGLVFQATIAGVCFLFSCVFNGPMLRLQAYKEQEELRKTTLSELDETKPTTLLNSRT